MNLKFNFVGVITKRVIFQFDVFDALFMLSIPARAITAWLSQNNVIEVGTEKLSPNRSYWIEIRRLSEGNVFSFSS